MPPGLRHSTVASSRSSGTRRASPPEHSCSSSQISSTLFLPSIWLKLRALRWDVTPVVVQDPTWEQSFPDVGGVLLPVRDAGSGEVGEILLSGREARARAHANEGRLESALGVFARLGFDPVVLGSSERSAIAEGFDRWASRRRRLRRRSA